LRLRRPRVTDIIGSPRTGSGLDLRDKLPMVSCGARLDIPLPHIIMCVDGTNGHTRGRRARRIEVPDEPQEPVLIYRRTRSRGSDAPSQSTTDTGHYLEIGDMPAITVEAATSTDPEQESDGDDFDYEDTDEVPYEGLDASTLVNRGPPVPSVYDDLSH